MIFWFVHSFAWIYCSIYRVKIWKLKEFKHLQGSNLATLSLSIKKQFKIITKAGSYIVKPESSRIFLSWPGNSEMLKKYKDWFMFKLYFIHGEHFKVMLSFASLEEGIQKFIRKNIK